MGVQALHPSPWWTGGSHLPDLSSHPRRHQFTDSQKAKPSIISDSSLLPFTARKTKGAEKDSLRRSHSTPIIGTILDVYLQHRGNQSITECRRLNPRLLIKGLIKALRVCSWQPPLETPRKLTCPPTCRKARDFLGWHLGVA